MSTLLIFGSLCMILMSFSIIIFVAFYQRKLFDKKNKIHDLENQSHLRLIQAEIHASEREQKRIAQDLHDDTGASLTSLRFYIAQLDDDTPQKKEMDTILKETVELISIVCNDLLPYALEELGIVDTLTYITKRFNKRTNSVVTLVKVDIVPDLELNYNQELALYRIVQELLNNIIKYAESTYIDLLLTFNNEEFRLEINDNGSGILPSLDGRLNSIGLRNIVNRLQYADATMVRVARRQRGTTVILRKSLK